jgi:hypothetical protein
MIDPVNLAIDNDNPFCKDKKIVKLTTTEKVRERRWANESRSEKANKCKDNMLAALLASHGSERKMPPLPAGLRPLYELLCHERNVQWCLWEIFRKTYLHHTSK